MGPKLLMQRRGARIIPATDQRQLVLPVGDDYFCRSPRVIIRYRRCRIGYGSASRNTEAKTNGRKDATDSGGNGRDERALSPEVAVWPLAIGDQDRAPVAHPSRSLRRGLGGGDTAPAPGRGRRQAQGNDNYRVAGGPASRPLQRLPAAHPATAITGPSTSSGGGLCTVRTRRYIPPKSIRRGARPRSTSPTATPWE